MDTIRNRWIFVGSLAGVFVVTLVMSHTPNFNNGLLGAIGFSGQNVTITPELSPSGMVTKMVTPKKMVTNKNVTIISSMSPSAVPIQTSPPLNTLASVSPASSMPGVSPFVTSPMPTHASTPTATISMTPTPRPMTPPPAQAPATVTPAPTATSAPQTSKININTAGLAELENITGVGPAIGQRIIDYRTSKGPFQQIEDIINVKGIGQATFLKMKDQITVGA